MGSSEDDYILAGSVEEGDCLGILGNSHLSKNVALGLTQSESAFHIIRNCKVKHWNKTYPGNRPWRAIGVNIICL
jgi:hypothetical protein